MTYHTWKYRIEISGSNYKICHLLWYECNTEIYVDLEDLPPEYRKSIESCLKEEGCL